MDVVEVAPPYDHAEVTAAAAHRCVLEAISALAAKRRAAGAEPIIHLGGVSEAPEGAEPQGRGGRLSPPPPPRCGRRQVYSPAEPADREGRVVVAVAAPAACTARPRSSRRPASTTLIVSPALASVKVTRAVNEPRSAGSPPSGRAARPEIVRHACTAAANESLATGASGPAWGWLPG